MPHERNFAKDVVYLYGFGRSKTIPCISPYSLKIETFLRLHKIPYENRFVVFQRSKHGLLPFIELNGETTADSQLIEERLKKHFNIKEFEDPMEAAQHRAIQRMLENHTFFVINKFKVIDNMNAMGDVFMKELSPFPKPVNVIMTPFLKMSLGGKARKRQAAALGNYTDEEFKMLLRRDFDAIRDLLGDKKFFAGDRITLTDCSVFGMIAPTYFIPVENYAKQLLKVDYPSIISFMERVRDEIWKDDFEKKDEKKEEPKNE